jgi:hypothetical protein
MAIVALIDAQCIVKPQTPRFIKGKEAIYQAKIFLPTSLTQETLAQVLSSCQLIVIQERNRIIGLLTTQSTYSHSALCLVLASGRLLLTPEELTCCFLGDSYAVSACLSSEGSSDICCHSNLSGSLHLFTPTLSAHLLPRERL